MTSTKLDPATWLDRYGDIMFRYAIARVRDKAAAEDLVQDTLLAAIGALDTFKGGSTEQTWLVGILRHKVLDYFRKSAREQPFERDWQESATERDSDFDEQGSWAVPIADWRTPEKSAERDEFWHALRGCLDTLPDNLRTVFSLRELDGLETDQLMETLDISTKNNLWVMLSRARKGMQKCLQAKWFGPS
ncbi:MAG: sigma-70 family RNA polymerase sigma factor [Proteobacteria bacterium]|nr:sigma-70 family RNA polymerase sigma factor [Pseudomonadota bacterium]